MALPTVQSKLKKLRSKSTSNPSTASPSRSPSPARASTMSTATTPSNGREIGTLIVIVLKANHLPNKRHIGKQDPYCVVTINGRKQRTKAIKKGGQHPEWDEELRFKIYEESESTPASDNGTPPPPPPKKGDKDSKLARIQGGARMRVACFADDLREPDFIGDADVDLTEVLTKGETDEWFTLMNKDRFAGKVYLELTFYSNEAPPQKKPVPAPVANQDNYGGSGLFVPAGPEGHPSPQPRIVSSSAIQDPHRRMSESIRPSSSMLDLYQPDYERSNRNSAIDTLNSSFNDFSVGEPRRSETYPPVQNGYSTFSSQPSHIYDPSVPNGSSGFSYEGQQNAPSTFRPRSSLSSLQAPYPPQAPYQPEYETTPSYLPTPPARGPRYSVPATSSGFVPLSSSSSFSTAPSEPSGFVPPASHTPAPYPSTFTPAPYPVPVAQTPMPQAPYSVPPSSSFYDNRPSTIPLSDSQYNIHIPSSILPPATPMPYGSAQPGSEIPTAPTTNSLSSSTGPGGSRPLPMPTGPSYNNLPPPPPLPPSVSQPIGNYSPSRMRGFTPVPFPSVPPPPPLPSSHSGSPHSYSPHSHSPQSQSPQPPQNELQLPAPPQLPPAGSYKPHTPSRRASLPVPPGASSGFQPLPLPPPPLQQYNDYQPDPLPNIPYSQSEQTLHPGPPPRPPMPLDGYSQPFPASVSYGGY